MQVNLGFNGNYSLFAGPTAGTGQIGGMNWMATLSSPNPALFGTGSLELVQIAAPNRSIMADPNTNGFYETDYWSLNGQEGLDKYYPYPWFITNQGALNTIYISQDLPGMSLDYLGLHSAQQSDQFYDYLMFFAPGSTQCVPVARLIWSVDGSATLPSTGNWADFGTGSAGTITPGSKPGDFLPCNEFPMWTQILIADDGHF